MQGLVKTRARYVPREEISSETIPGFFAGGVNFYKLFWVFLIVSFLGCLVETAFMLLTRGVLQNRSGVLFGPFSLVWGLGAALFTLCFQTLGIEEATRPRRTPSARWRRSRPWLAPANPRAAALPSHAWSAPGVRRSFLRAKLDAGKADEAAGLAPGNEDNAASGQLGRKKPCWLFYTEGQLGKCRVLPIFLAGTVLGAVYEYACSWLQEVLFGACFWDYSHLPFNINGRVNLMFSLFWGAAAVLWVKAAYPALCRWIGKIPNQMGRPLTLCLTALMIFNIAITTAALGRMDQRRKGVEAGTAVEAFLDAQYPDRKLQRIFTNLTYIGTDEARTAAGVPKTNDIPGK